MTKRILWSASMLAVAGCATSTLPAGGGAPSNATTAAAQPSDNDEKCSAHRSAAVDQVSAVIEKSRGCAQDSDCVVVTFGASCFDACTRVISKSGSAAYDEALQQADATHCDAFKKDGCRPPIPPPCAPPMPVSCKSGLCG